MSNNNGITVAVTITLFLLFFCVLVLDKKVMALERDHLKLQDSFIRLQDCTIAIQNQQFQFLTNSLPPHPHEGPQRVE